uniref:Uncharacterized protein n=1 Tax=viral metagenome TaxID=1070528 RepID=A0A2V0RJ65_9ZZZZ
MYWSEVVKLADSYNPLSNDDLPLNAALAMVGAVPATAVAVYRHSPALIAFLMKQPAFLSHVAKAAGPGFLSTLVARNTYGEAEARGQDGFTAGLASTAAQLELGSVSTGNTVLPKGPSQLAKAGRGGAAMTRHMRDIASAVAKPTRGAVIKAVKAPVKIGAGAVKGVAGLANAGKGLGRGLGIEAAGTALGGAVLQGLSRTGVLEDTFDALGADISQEDIQRHVDDFTTTEIGGVTVPNVDPINSVLKTTGAIQDLHDVNQDRGYHGDDAYSTGKFVHDEISEELGDGIIGHAVGGTAGLVVGGVTGAGNVLKDLWPL